MSLRNDTSKGSHRDSKRNSGSCSFPAPKQPKHSPVSRSSPPPKPRKQSPSMQPTAVTAALASSSRLSPSHNATPMTESTSDTYQALKTHTSDHSAYTPVELLEVAAWMHPHQSPQYYQDFSYNSHNSRQSPACPFHISTLGIGRDTAWPGYGMAPVERWLEEDVVRGGTLALQLGHQLHADCTCIVMQDGMGMDAMNGQQRDVASGN